LVASLAPPTVAPPTAPGNHPPFQVDYSNVTPGTAKQIVIGRETEEKWSKVVYGLVRVICVRYHLKETKELHRQVASLYRTTQDALCSAVHECDQIGIDGDVLTSFVELHERSPSSSTLARVRSSLRNVRDCTTRIGEQNGRVQTMLDQLSQNAVALSKSAQDTQKKVEIAKWILSVVFLIATPVAGLTAATIEMGLLRAATVGAMGLGARGGAKKGIEELKSVEDVADAIFSVTQTQNGPQSSIGSISTLKIFFNTSLRSLSNSMEDLKFGDDVLQDPAQVSVICNALKQKANLLVSRARNFSEQTIAAELVARRV